MSVIQHNTSHLLLFYEDAKARKQGSKLFNAGTEACERASIASRKARWNSVYNIENGIDFEEANKNSGSSPSKPGYKKTQA